MTADLRIAMAEKDMLIMAVPSVYVRSTAAKMKEYLRYGQIVVDVAKGIEEQSLMTMSQVIEEELPLAEVAVLSGPSHAEEVSRGLPTTCVAAAHRKKTAEFMQSVFMSPVFRIYTSPDMLGVEIGAALKMSLRWQPVQRMGWDAATYEGGADHPRNCGDCPSGYCNGRKTADLLRIIRHR